MMREIQFRTIHKGSWGKLYDDDFSLLVWCLLIKQNQLLLNNTTIKNHKNIFIANSEERQGLLKGIKNNDTILQWKKKKTLFFVYKENILVLLNK